MSITKETDVNPLSQLFDELKTLLSGIVVKYSSEADKYETFENRKYSDTYIAAINKTDTMGYYDYSAKEYIDAGVSDPELIEKFQNGEIERSKTLNEKLLLNRRARIIETYDEPNDYYRKLNGLPPKNTIGGTIVTSIMNKSLLVVTDDDAELKTDYMSKRITETSAYAIMGNNLFTSGNHIIVTHAVLQNTASSYTRSFLIVPDEYPATKGTKVVYLRDVKSIINALDRDLEIPGEEVIGKYLHIAITDTLDTTTYFKHSYLVVEDNELNYDKSTMIKISEALLNNKHSKVGDNLVLGNYFYVSDEISELYGISTKVPIHEISDYYGERFIYILESSGYLDKFIEANPDKEYLKFIGTKRVDILKARAAKNFDILYLPPCSREVIQWVFSVSYNSARDYFVNTVYNYYYRSVYDYYDNFIALAIVQLAISQTIAKSMQTAIDRDFYDETMVRLLFEMYGVPYYPNLPYQTQRRLVKNLNYLIQRKATNAIILDIASILGYHDINVYKYYLVKERKFDSDGNLIYKDTTTVEPTMDVDGMITEKETIINDLERMYDVYFQKVDIDEVNFQVALTDEAKRVSYPSVVLEDPLWWDDADTFSEVYGDYEKYTADTEPTTYHKHYNYRETKYLGISISYKMSEVIYENILLLRLLFDKKDELKDIFVTLPKITGTMEINIFDVVVYLCALISKQFHIKGEILTRYSSIMDVMGYITENVDGYKACDTLVFNFELLTNAETYKEIIEKPSRFLRPDERDKFFKYLSVLTLNQATVKEKITAINEMYQNMKGLGYFIGRKMSEANNLFEYRAWKDFYEALFIGHENAEMFKLGNTDNVATTYAEYLQVMNPALYNTMINADDGYIYTYIDHTISRLELVVHNLKTLYTVNDSNSALLDYLIKLIKFFKSYTTDLIDATTEFIFDSRPDNLFKLVEYYKIFQVILPKDRYHLMYADTLKAIETTKKIDPLKYKDMIALMNRDYYLSDTWSINNITCSSCKNFNNCRAFCKNDKNTCTGTYKVGPNDVECKYYGYDTSEFLNYINHYRDLLLGIDTKDFYDVSVKLRSHLKQAYAAYKLVDGYNPYSDELTFYPDKLKELLYDSLDKLNDALELRSFDFTVSENGVEGIIKYIDLYTVTGSNIPRICKNAKYPCRSEEECRFRDVKDIAYIKETLYHDEYLQYSVMVDLYATMWVDEDVLFSDDVIHKVIETWTHFDESKLYDTDKVEIKRTLVFNEKTLHYMDTLANTYKEDIASDSLKYRETLIMYEES